ncbi:hypothetical protein Bbelb_213590 [Branchiostoma belcheri]|nr:hypothetical protein Bbelb_213590 [Branchiostoma belcheri]
MSTTSQHMYSTRPYLLTDGDQFWLADRRVRDLHMTLKRPDGPRRDETDLSSYRPPQSPMSTDSRYSTKPYNPTEEDWFWKNDMKVRDVQMTLKRPDGPVRDETEISSPRPSYSSTSATSRYSTKPYNTTDEDWFWRNDARVRDIHSTLKRPDGPMTDETEISLSRPSYSLASKDSRYSTKPYHLTEEDWFWRNDTRVRDVHSTLKRPDGPVRNETNLMLYS